MLKNPEWEKNIFNTVENFTANCFSGQGEKISNTVYSKHQIARAAFRLWVNCNRHKTGDIYRNINTTKKDFKYSLR